MEEVFTFLSERINAPETASQLRTQLTLVWDALLAEFVNVFSRFPPNRRTKRVYRTFYNQHILSRDTVVSFNYDTVFERSLPNSIDWYYAGVDKTHNPGALRIIKPHGSINWEGQADGSSEVKVRNEPSRPVIVAPTHLKFVGSTNELEPGQPPPIGYIDKSVANVWAELVRQMRDAKALVFIGYSFPVSDLYFSSVLRSVLAARDTDPAIVIVNPQAMAISDRLKGRFSIQRTATYFDLDTYIQVTRRQVLRSSLPNEATDNA